MRDTARTIFICRDQAMGGIVDAIAARLEQQGIEVIRGPLPAPGVKYTYPPETHAALFGRAEAAMFGGSIGSREVMLAAPRLSGIVSPGIGVDTVDLDAAGELGIIVGHGATPENYLGTTEATVMSMLVLSLQLHRTERMLRENLPRPSQQHTWVRGLRGRTIGLVGFGRIGRAVADRLRAFEVELLAYHPRLTQAQMPADVTLVDLDTLLARSGMVSLHAALNDSSKEMIGERELGLMKPDAYLINTARGGLVDEAALYRALRDKRIAGAALDVFAVEPLPVDSPLRGLDNIVLTPHFAGSLREGFESLVRAGVENFERILAGELPRYCKNPQVEPKWRERLAKLG